MKFKKLTSPWKPENPNDEISGKLIKIDSEVGENKSMMYIFVTETNIQGVWGSTVLDEKMKVFNVGNFVKIVFLGKKEGSRKEGYKDYDVYLAEEES